MFQKSTGPTLVLGASENKERTSYTAIKKLLSAGHEVLATGAKEGMVHGIKIEKKIPFLQKMDTITLYIRPEIQNNIIQEILNVNPRRIIFNPGTENQKLETEALQKGIICVHACTLVLLSLNQY